MECGGDLGRLAALLRGLPQEQLAGLGKGLYSKSELHGCPRNTRLFTDTLIPINRSQTQSVHSIAIANVYHLQHANNLSLIYCILSTIRAEIYQKRLSISSSLSVYSK